MLFCFRFLCQCTCICVIALAFVLFREVAECTCTVFRSVQTRGRCSLDYLSCRVASAAASYQSEVAKFRRVLDRSDETAMSPACCATASSEEANLAPSGMDVTSELDKDAQFLQALFCCPITKVKCTLPGYKSCWISTVACC